MPIALTLLELLTRFAMRPLVLVIGDWRFVIRDTPFSGRGNRLRKSNIHATNTAGDSNVATAKKPPARAGAR